MTTDPGPACLVTGVAGFLGSHLAERLLDLGHAVTGIDAFTPYYDRGQKEANLRELQGRDGFRFIAADLSRDAIEGWIPEGGWVFHQAAQPGVRASWDLGFPDYVNHNVLATQRLLEACRGAMPARFVMASSSSVYGNVPAGLVSEDAELRPLSPYGVTKVASERLVDAYHLAFGLHTTSLRYFTVCGPRQRPDMAFHQMLRSLHTEQPFVLYGDGTQERDFTFVGDAVEANLLAARHAPPGSVYNVGGGRPIALSRAVAVIEEIVGRRLERRELPRAEGDPGRTAANVSRAHRELGYDPSVPVEEALRREAAWFTGPSGPLALASETRS